MCMDILLQKRVTTFLSQIKHIVCNDFSECLCRVYKTIMAILFPYLLLTCLNKNTLKVINV